jgi:hypothetical protein
MFLTNFILITLFASGGAIDCPCSSYSQKYWPIQKQVRVERKYAKAIFSGDVVSAMETKSAKGHFLVVRFKVVRSWKNIHSRMVTIITDYPAPGGCGYAFQTGRSYLVYVDRNDLGHLQATICSRTMPIENALAEMRALGHGKRWS